MDREIYKEPIDPKPIVGGGSIIPPSIVVPPTIGKRETFEPREPGIIPIVPTTPGFDKEKFADPYGEEGKPKKYTGGKEVAPTPLKEAFAGSGMLGTARSVGDKINALQLISQFWGGSVESGKAIIRRFMGIFTKPGRDHAPLGALEDVRNLEPNVKTGALTLRKGSSAYASTFVDVSGTTLTQIDKFFPLSTEVPTASDIDIVLGRTAGDAKHIFQKPFWANGAKVNSYMDFADLLTKNVAATPSFPGGTFLVDAGLPALKDWFCYFTATDGAVPNGPYLVLSYNSGTGEVVVSPQLAYTIAEDDEVVFYRYPLFDKVDASLISYSTDATKPPVCLQQGQAVLFSGGQSSNYAHRAVWSGYVSRTWLNGATGKPTGLATARTEVSWADVSLKTQLTVDAGISAPLTVGALTAFTTTSELNLANGKWFAGVVPQTDDGMLGLPIMSSGTVTTTGSGITLPLKLRLPTFNKRIRYLNIIMGKADNDTDTTIPWGNLYVVKTLDLEDGLDWTYTETVPATLVLGFYSINVDLDKSEYDQAGEATVLTAFMGSNEPSGTELSFSIAKFVTGRLFVARYYDFHAGTDYNDHIRFSTVSGDGIYQVNFLSDAHPDGTSVTTVDLGDATSIQALEKWEDKLFIIKDSSCYYMPISGNEPSTWSIITVSTYIGCTAPSTLVATPYGIMWCQPADDVYIWDGGSPVSMTQDVWRETFKALTFETNASAWFSIEKKSYSFFDSGANIWYSTYFEVPIADGIYSWFKHDIPNTDDGETPAYFNAVTKFFQPREGVEYFLYSYVDDTPASQIGIGKLDSSASTDVLGYGIAPYLKTAKFRLSEEMIAQVHHWTIANENAGINANYFVVKFTIGSNFQLYSHATTVPTFIRRGVLQGADRGRSIQIEVNQADLKATFTTFEIHQIGFKYELKPFLGDKTITS